MHFPVIALQPPTSQWHRFSQFSPKDPGLHTNKLIKYYDVCFNSVQYNGTMFIKYSLLKRYFDLNVLIRSLGMFYVFVLISYSVIFIFLIASLRKNFIDILKVYTKFKELLPSVGNLTITNAVLLATCRLESCRRQLVFLSSSIYWLLLELGTWCSKMQFASYTDILIV